MTTLNPLGDKPFWVNVYPKGRPFHPIGYPDKRSALVSQGDDCLYRLKVTPWIPHDGGPCPVGPDVMVRVKLTDGFASNSTRADHWTSEYGHDAPDLWQWKGTEDCRIIAYQIVE